MTDPELAKFIFFVVPAVMLTSALLVVIFFVLFPRVAIVAELLFASVILRPVLLDPMRRVRSIVNFQNIQAVDIRDELRSVACSVVCHKVRVLIYRQIYVPIGSYASRCGI